MALTDGPGGKEVGRLSLKVVPDTSGFGSKLQAFADRMEQQVEVELPVRLNFESVSDDLESLHAQMEARHMVVDVEGNIDSDGAHREATLLPESLEAVMRPVEVRIDFDIGHTLRQMREHLFMLETLALAHPPEIRPTIDGTRAMVGMAALLARLKLMSTFASASTGAGEFGKNVALWGPLIFVALAGIMAIGPALAALIPLVLGFAGGIGVILLSLNQLKDTFGPLWDALKGMSDAVGPTLVAGLQPFVTLMVSQFIPVLQEGLVVLAGVMNTGIKSMLGFLSSAEGLAVVGGFFTALGPALEPFALMMGPITEAILRLATSAAPALQMMGNSILGAVEGFNQWIQGADAAGTITDSMAMLGDLLSVVGQLIAELFPPMFAVAPAVIAMLHGMVDVVGFLANALQPVFEWMSANATIMKIVGAVIIGIIAAVAAVAAVTVVWGVLAASTATLIGAAIGGIIGFLIFAWRRFEGFRNFMTGVWNVVVAGFNMLLAAGRVVFTALGAVVSVLVVVFKAWWAYVSFVFSAFMLYVKVWWTVVSTAFAIVAGVVRILIAVFRLVWAVVSPFFTLFMLYIKLWWTVAKAAFSAVAAAVRALSPVWRVMRSVIVAVVSAIMERVNAFMAVVRAVFGVIAAAISVFVAKWKTMSAGVATAINQVTDKVNSIKSTISNALSNAGTLLYDKGKALIQGLIDGIRAMIGAVGDAMGGIGSKIKAFLPGSPVREGPLTSWNNGGAGKRLMGLLADGVHTGGSSVLDEFDAITGQMDGMVQGLDFTPAFEGLSSKFKGGQIDVTEAGSDRLLLQMTDWESGKGVMRSVSETEYAGRAGVEQTRALMGGN